jgi:O-methyltransferase
MERRPFVKLLQGLRAWRRDTAALVHKVEALREAQDEKLAMLIAAVDNQTGLLSRKFDELHEGQDNQSDLLNRKFDQLRERQNCARPDMAVTNGTSAKADIDADSRHLIDGALAILADHVGREDTAAYIFDHTLSMVRRHHRSMFWGDRLLTFDKSAGFRDDPDFHKAIAAASSATGSNQYASPDGIHWRFNTLIWAARQALAVPGDFVECGVYEGDMSWVMTEMVDLAAAGRELHLFDTFAGFAPEYSSRSDFPENPEFFASADQDYKRPEIYQKVLSRFAAKPYVHIHRGAVPDTLSQAPPTIAFLHLDMNSPGPETAALDTLYDRLSPGAMVIYDDYGWILHRKQKEAADEFMSGKGIGILELPTGQGLAIKPKQ